MKKIILILPILLMFFGCSVKTPKLLEYEQNITALIKDVYPLKADLKVYESRYYMPWRIKKINLLASKASWANAVFKRKVYFSQNLRLWDQKKVDKIIQNTNFENFNKINRYAITTKTAQVRNLPTNKPFFKNPKFGGEGFPFDYMQNTLLHVNTPLFISHLSSDGAWAFVQSPVSIGWIRLEDIKFIDAKQRYEFMKSPKIVITKDNIPLYDAKQNYKLHVKLGAIFPKDSEDDDFYYSHELSIPKEYAKDFPLDFNKQNILYISHELLGEEYGWGGYYKSRDCSSMSKDYFSIFGVWLPRNSYYQGLLGQTIDLKDLGDKEKENMIKKYAIPFVSLIYLPGHIMLYAGTINDKAMVMHDTWGVKTKDDDRLIIGKTIISDLYLGANQNNADKEKLLIKKATKLVIEPKANLLHVESFIRAYPSIISLKDNKLIFDDNTSLVYDDFKEKSFEKKLSNPSPKDMLSITYKAFSDIIQPDINEDAGRFRNEKLLKKLYGNTKEEIKKNLETLTWTDGTNIKFNKKQNASIQLQKVINELKKLPKKYQKFLSPIGGTFNYRYIKDTKRLSAHSFGIAIDLNVKQSKYWKWDKTYKYSNNFPKKIIDIFEKYGFIWGGRWYHYDTMHFEYRPEMFESID